MSLIARHLEENGLPTVIMGCGRDIVEHVGVARFLYSEFPLGNSAGKPDDADSQRETLHLALALFDAATEPRTTFQSPQRWADNDNWQYDFLNIDALTADKVAALKADFARQKQIANRLKRA